MNNVIQAPQIDLTEQTEAVLKILSGLSLNHADYVLSSVKILLQSHSYVQFETTKP